MSKIDRQAHVNPNQDLHPEEKADHPAKTVCGLNDDQLAAASFLAKSLSDGNRLRILLLLADGKRSVSAIVDELGLSQALVSHHLKELRRSLLVTVKRRGPFVYYSLADPRILDVIDNLDNIANQLLTERRTF